MKYALLFLLAASTAHADVNNEVSFGSHARALRTDSANALTDRGMAGPSIFYARRLPIETVPDLELWGTANILGGFTDGTMFQTLETEASTLQMAVGARARYPLWRKLVVANARLDAGTQRVRVEIEDAAGHSASDSGWGATSTAALGIELVPLNTRRFGLGIRAELGYVMTSSIDLTAKSDGAPEDTIELDRMAASLGHLDIGGRYFSLVISALF